MQHLPRRGNGARIMKRLTIALVLAFTAGWTTRGAAQDPAPRNPHGALGQGVDCADCHTADKWTVLRAQLKLSHKRFPLTGKHAGVSCAGCHLDLRFDEPKFGANQCGACHADVHRGNMNGECVRCHNSSTFREVPAVAIHSRTGFPLTGAHLQSPCEGCHRTEQNGAYSAVARDCASCHRSASAAAAGVDHSVLPADCSQCHAPFSWSGGVVFDHTTASHGFSLLGAHQSLRCQSCHPTGSGALRFSPAPTGTNDCYACHQPDYQRAHAGNGFPTTCTGCHDMNSWTSNFNHDATFFPIASGAHRGTACTTCHNVPSDFKTFTCLTCHEHSQTAMASRHSGRSNYAYDSQACYRCHPR
jgi:hypothetical protein